MLKILVIALVVLVMIRLGLYRWERSCIYYPQAALEGLPSQVGLDFHDIQLYASDGVKLHGWYIPNPKASHALLFLHGNAGNISHRIGFMPFFHAAELSQFYLEYRGYGKSGGRPSEQGFYRDAQAAYDYVRNTLKMKPEQIILFGESLGGAVAIDLASKVPVAAVVCDGAFSRMLDVGRHYFPHLPVRWILSQHYDSVSKVGKITAPKYFIHSRNDEIIPFALGQRLFQEASGPKEFIPRSGEHSNLLAEPSIYESLFEKIFSPSE